ncbi:MAG: NADH-quinone oxidoreductase subunit L [Myxococcaceae bacterium]
MNTLPVFLQQSLAPVNAVASSLWLIVALPLLGTLVCGVFGKVLGRANVHWVALGAVGGSFLLSALTFSAIANPDALLPTVFSNPGQGIRYAVGQDLGTWFAVGDFIVRFGLRVDHLSGVLLLVITGVGFLIHLYSTEYMSHDDGYWRYFAYLNLFVAMMLTLVMADNLVLLFVGWEGVGLCSYLLIGFWYKDPQKAWAGRKAFITNRIGDFAFVVGMLLLTLMVGAASEQLKTSARPQLAERYATGVSQVGALHFTSLEQTARTLANGARNSQENVLQPQSLIRKGPLRAFRFSEVLTAVLVLFLIGAAGKSAQIPLYVWLPDAMAGPTPVSALIHAATMVTAGVYLFCRLSYLLVFSPTAMAAVAVVGACTALFAALIAFAQDDIKKVLAYSTVSQLGMMFMAVGMGVFWAAVLHLVTHAFFKALLFLGAGSVMHGNDDETDIKKLGGLRRQMPWTWATFAVGTAAITGIVPLSGFFSKDAILHGVHETTLAGLPWVPHLVYVLGLLTALCTAFYMTRLYLLTFEGERSTDAKVPHAHENRWPMTLPLVVLAFFSVVALVHGIPFLRPRGTEGLQALMENYLYPVFDTARLVTTSVESVKAPVTEHVPWDAYLQAWGIALVGGATAAFMYLRFFPSRRGQTAPALARAARHFAQAKFYVDELYDALLLRPIRALAVILYRVVDALLIDTVAVRGSAWVTARAGALLRYTQTGDVQSYAAAMVLALLGGAAYVLVQVLR